MMLHTLDIADEMDEMIEENKILKEHAKNQQIIFFLGAGASVEAGVPTTTLFVKEFENHLIETERETDKELYDLLNKIKEYLDKKDIDIESLLETMENLTDLSKTDKKLYDLLNKIKDLDKKDIDIESLLETMENLTDLSKTDKKLYDLLNKIKDLDKKDIDIESLLETMENLTDYIEKTDSFSIRKFLKDPSMRFDENEKKNILKLTKKLRAFIREKTVVVKGEKVDYLHPLLEITKPLTVFSVNYDTCIETLALRNKLKYTDGFGIEWEPERFKDNKDKFDIYLYKIHGSIMWYETKKQNYVKIPVLFNQEETDEIKLMTAETASPFIMYPSPSKWKYNKILDFLRMELRNKLKNTDICVVIGYSFRDDDIKEIFEDAAKSNEDLKILLISPSAGKIHKKLKYMDKEKKVLSQVYEKVIPINHTFSKTLNDNNLYDLINEKIPRIRMLCKQANSEPLPRDFYPDYIKEYIRISLEIGDVVGVENIFNKYLNISPPDNWGNFGEEEQFEILYQLYFLYLFNGDEKIEKFLKYVIKLLKRYLDGGNELFELYLKKQKSNEEDSKNIDLQIKTLNEMFGENKYHEWSIRHSELISTLESLSSFLSKKIELGIQNKEQPELSNMLKSLIDSIEKISSIRNIGFQGDKYEDSPIVKADGTKVELERKKDLENALKEIINNLEKLEM